MSTVRLWLQRLLSIAIAGIGIYMFSQFPWPAPPAVSGLAFVLIALALWIPHCPILGLLLQDKPKDNDHDRGTTS